MRRPGFFYLIFAISGFTGLIYESIWTHYLKLFLGHAAYAQTLVLAIFMGGMALGAYICSKWSRRWPNLLSMYALVEGIIGLAALAYHPLFDAGINYFYSAIVPLLDSQFSINICKWGISTLSILPQSVLLGMTFPLMSGAFLRLFPEHSGRSLSMLYFTNSIGAVFGVLASGFILVDLVGFPGTIGFAGIVNIALAITVRLLVQRDFSPAASGQTPDQTAMPAPAETPSIYQLLLLVALGTGTASFIYEIAWIRMLALVLGSSTHAFELMLSAFLLGLATGGLWIKRRIDTLDRPILFLAGIQLAMGLLAIATLPMYNRMFPIMQWLVSSLPKSDLGYTLFNLGSYGIASAIMLPATFCAGMTLPLITNILFRTGHGEKSIGAVYAANTIGAIIGIFGAVHLILPTIGLKGLLTSGAALDMTLAIILVASARNVASKKLVLSFAAACAAAVTFSILFVNLDPYKMASGVYRSGVKLLSPENISLLYHKDSKTATITVAMAKSGVTNIITNGKSDSAINLNIDGTYSLDEATTILSGALPFFYNPNAQLVANIGLGTGLTTQTVLTSPNVQRVDTIEIEKAVIEGAQHFRSRTDLVYTDRRSNIIIDDAKSVISSNGRIYDVIVSEPSNPWVSGVANLFSDEFYHHIRNHLHDEGLFVQWIQLYESDMHVVASVFKALARNFSDYSVYLTGGNADLMVVAKKNGSLGQLNPAALNFPAMQSLLTRIKVKGLPDIRVREIGSKKLLDPLFQSYPIQANSDYFPVLDQRVGKTKFMNTGAFQLLQLAGGQIPYMPFMHLITNARLNPDFGSIAVAADCGMTLVAKQGVGLRDYLLSGKFPDDIASDERVLSGIRDTAFKLRQRLLNCSPHPEAGLKELLDSAAIAMIPYLTEEQMNPVWKLFETPACQTGMSAVEKQHLAFFKALSTRNFGRVAIMSRQLLAEDQQLSQGMRQYILGVGMLASIANGKRTEARELYQQAFGSREQTDIILRLLYAHSRL